MKYLLVFLVSINFVYGQSKWKSINFGYEIEIPKSFKKTNEIIRQNIDFKAVHDKSSVVIIVTSVPKEFINYSLYNMLGNLDEYSAQWELGAKDFFNNPKVIKYGKTTIDSKDAFWLDYISEGDNLYSKTFTVKKGNKIYTITLSNPKNQNSEYSTIWQRFKNSVKF